MPTSYIWPSIRPVGFPSRSNRFSRSASYLVLAGVHRKPLVLLHLYSYIILPFPCFLISLTLPPVLALQRGPCRCLEEGRKGVGADNLWHAYVHRPLRCPHSRRIHIQERIVALVSDTQNYYQERLISC